MKVRLTVATGFWEKGAILDSKEHGQLVISRVLAAGYAEELPADYETTEAPEAPENAAIRTTRPKRKYTRRKKV